MDEWISVKDQLPTKYSGNTIVCLINGHPILCNVHDCTLCLNTDRISFYWPDSRWIKDAYFSEPTHWMPLPNIPDAEMYDLGNISCDGIYG